MRTMFAVAIAFGLANSVGADEAEQKEIAKLQGTWIVSHAEKGGKKLSQDERLALNDGHGYLLTKVVFDKETVEIWIQNGAKGKLESLADKPIRFKVDVTAMPKRIHLQAEEGVWMSYSLAGRTLAVCRHEKDGDTPKSLDTKDNDKWYLYVFKKDLPLAEKEKAARAMLDGRAKIQDMRDQLRALYQRVIEDYAGTTAAEEAKKLLEKLK